MCAGGLLLALLSGFVLTAGAIFTDFGVRSAHAQFWGGWGWGGGGWGGDRPVERPRRPVQRQQQQQQGFGFPFFGGRPSYRSPSQRYRDDEPRRRPRQAEGGGSRAPSPQRKAEAPPAKTVLVFGDGMADWLAHGLEEAFSESSELGVIRKHRTGSTLIRNDARDHDWLQGVRDGLAAEKADFVVMMIGLADRHGFRERPPQRTAAPTPGPNIAQEEERRGSTLHEFRSEKWVELYGKRVDEIIAALKTKRVPVLWVGLPPIRGPKSRADLAFINDIFKERAEKAGIVFIDVWEGFLNEDGDFSSYGPDLIGQVRRLRSGDGVYFTRAGARKLAHFVDREIRRMLSRETPVALPAPEEPTPSAPTGPAPRPTVGPVISLTGGTPAAENLLGARPQDAQVSDPLANSVLVKGEPPPPQAGRADSFVWPAPYTVTENGIVEPPPEPVAAAPRPAAAPTTARAPAPLPGRRPPTQSASRPARPVQ